MAEKTNIRIGLFGYGRSNAGVLGAMRKRFPALRLVLRCDAPPSALPEFSDGIEVEYRCGAEAERNIDEDILFLSPSVRPDRPALLEAEARGVTISSDAKMFFSGLPAFGVSPFSGVRLAVTGSDGKSSVTALTAAMTGGIACGNFGRSFSSVPDGAIAVCELSSFQLTEPPYEGIRDTEICETGTLV